MFGLFGDLNAREVKKLQPVVKQINARESEIEQLTKEQMQQRVSELKTHVQKSIDAVLGDEHEAELLPDEDAKDQWRADRVKKVEREVLEEVLIEAFALVREAAKRTLKERHYDVQLIGGMVLHQGKIAEMKTGEGKTLVATLPAFLNALTGSGVHIVTVNDYLAKRDAAWMGQIYHYLGLSVAAIGHEASLLYDPLAKKKLDKQAESEAEEQGLVYTSDDSPLIPTNRKEAYGADITYGTNNEFGFDYLRDNMAQHTDQMVQRDVHYAIVDEVDSILIDEARTPLIISAPAEESTGEYRRFAKLVTGLEAQKHYTVDEKLRAVSLTDAGMGKMEELLGIKNIYEAGGVMLVHHLEEALKAEVLFQRDKDYVVRDGEVIIVDEFTGRMMPGRRYSEGLHQAIEAKEGVEVKQESLTLATISFQNLFRLYHKLAGMTGTAATEAEEFHKIYKLDVVEIPTNEPNQRDDSPDQIYKTLNGKFQAVIADIMSRHEKGQPVLVGTVSIEKNELLSKALKQAGVAHDVLNAKNHEQEAHIIAKAGHIGSVTVATNMAGRGTDIKLAPGVADLGGLHVIGTERHESRRIDNQLRGRTGRQGDPGTTQFFISMDDDLMRIFGGDRLKSVMTTLRIPEDQPIEHGMINRAIEGAQKKVEGHNFDIRKHLVEYDDVMNKHREVIYRRRRRVLLGAESQKEEILELIADLCRSIFESRIEAGVNTSEIGAEIERTFGVKLQGEISLDAVMHQIHAYYDQKEKGVGADTMRLIERSIYLQAIDSAWIDHLTSMDHLRDGIGLRGYGQYDPLVAYKQEAYQMFQRLLDTIEQQVAQTILRVQVVQQAPAQPKQVVMRGAEEADSEHVFEEVAAEENSTATSSPVKASLSEKAEKVQRLMVASESEQLQAKKGEAASRLMGDQAQSRDKAVVSKSPKVGRNDPCPCGSGKKYKKCHGK